MWKVQCIFLSKLRPDRCLIGENRWRNSWETLIRLKVVWRQIKWQTISSIQPAGGNEGVVWQCRWIINDTSWNLLLACASPIFGRNPERLPHESGAAKLRTDVNVFLFWREPLDVWKNWLGAADGNNVSFRDLSLPSLCFHFTARKCWLLSLFTFNLFYEY